MIRVSSASAVEKQLDQLEIVMNAFMIAAIVVFYEAASATLGKKPFALFGVELDHDNAYSFVVAFYDCVFLVLCNICWKVGDLIENADGDEREKTTAVVLTHKWILNPFAYSGRGLVSIANGAIGVGVLVFSWWIGWSSMVLLASNTPKSDVTDSIDKALRYLFPTLAILGLYAITRILKMLFGRMEGQAETPEDERRIRTTLLWIAAAKCLTAAIAAFMGWYLYYQCLRLA